MFDFEETKIQFGECNIFFLFFIFGRFCMQFECKKVTETSILYFFCVKEEEKERKINI